jgi:hypothetical protein
MRFIRRLIEEQINEKLSEAKRFGITTRGGIIRWVLEWILAGIGSIFFIILCWGSIICAIMFTVHLAPVSIILQAMACTWFSFGATAICLGLAAMPDKEL